MTLFALDERMGADQRESVLVILNGLDRYIPTLDGVAAFAVCSELAAMDIGVTVGAGFAHILEIQASVALHASHRLVHSAQRVSGRVVFEFRNGSDRLPTRIGVAVLAGNGGGTMRIGDFCVRICRAFPYWCLLSSHAGEQGQQPHTYRNEPAFSIHDLLR